MTGGKLQHQARISTAHGEHRFCFEADAWARVWRAVR